MCTRDDNQTIDIAFLLDSDVSSNDFLRMRRFVSTVIGGLVGDVRVGVYQFVDSNVQANLHFGDYATVLEVGRL